MSSALPDANRSVRLLSYSWLQLLGPRGGFRGGALGALAPPSFGYRVSGFTVYVRALAKLEIIIL